VGQSQGKLRRIKGTGEPGVPTAYVFWCPGCKYHHIISTQGPRPNWVFTGTWEAPTFMPSLNVGPNTPRSQCHSWIKAGKIEFLQDCWHSLKGKTVDMVDIELSDDQIFWDD
jgi:hypothetical protein